MEPTTHTIKLTNGAAHVAIACLVHGLSSPSDIWTAGQLRAKFKAAKKMPEPLETEKRLLPTGEEVLLPAYRIRADAWLEAPFGEVTLEEEEREVLKAAVLALSKKEQLPKNEFIDATTELVGLLGLSKKS